MEHEFVPGKRRCRGCGTRKADLEELGITACEGPDHMGVDPLGFARPAAEPQPEPQMWHLNVWTTVNDVVFTGSHQYVGPDVIGWAQTEAVNKVKEIVAGYTAEETE